MNILRLILDNLKRGTLTAPFPEKQQHNSGYRGLVHIDEERCVGCGQCAYSCPSCAMEVHRDGDKYQWKYDAGKCTFCGRCIERCKLHVLSMEAGLPPVYGVEGELKQEWNLTRKRPAKPAPVVNEASDVARPAAPAPAQETEPVVKKVIAPATSTAVSQVETRSDNPPAIIKTAEQSV